MYSNCPTDFLNKYFKPPFKFPFLSSKLENGPHSSILKISIILFYFLIHCNSFGPLPFICRCKFQLIWNFTFNLGSQISKNQLMLSGIRERVALLRGPHSAGQYGAVRQRDSSPLIPRCHCPK